MELISIVMPTYKNEGEPLSRAINSLIKQSYHSWELILIDDNVDIKYTNIVKEVVKKFNNPKIYYIKNKCNLGSAKSRNKGIGLAKGNYVTFLDDDDEYLENKLKVQLNKMLQTNADYSITNLDIKNENNQIIRKRRHNYLTNYDNENLLAIHLKHHLTGTDTLMFKKNYLEKIGGFDEIDIGDEFFLMLKAIENNGIFLYDDSVQVIAYTHKAGIGMTAGKKKVEGENDLLKIKKTYFSILNKKDIHYIMMRHYLVLVSYYMKSTRIIISLKYLCLSFLSSPASFCRLMLNRKEY